MQCLLWLLSSLFVVSGALAQNTSSTISGRVMGADSKPVANASIEVLHIPSNSSKTATTDADGRYTVRNLRVGGPFKVTATKEGMKAIEKSDVYLALAEDTTVDLEAAPAATDATALEATTVTASAQQTVFQADNKGLATNIDRKQIEEFPSIARSIQDYVRLDPRIAQTDKQRGEISAVGQNSRYNNISIDAVPSNDEFGLEATGLPAQNGSQPISIDTIQEFNVSTANYDVTNARAVGAYINAVTKSGSNEFHGSVYTAYRSNDWVGDNEAGSKFTGFDKQTTKGFTLGGPIVADTLFFFLGYEEYESAAPGPDVGPQGSGASTEAGITQDQLNQIINIAQNTWGFDPGSLSKVPNADLTDKKYLAKLDWNINQDHRLSFRYNHAGSDVPVFSNLSATSLSLSSWWYNKAYNFDNYVVNLYDDWTENFSSEASISYGQYENRSLPFSMLPAIRVNVSSTNAVFLGTELSRQANLLDVDTIRGFWAGNWMHGDHTIKFGADFQRTSMYNVFLQNYYGNYTFASIDDFATGKYSDYQLQQPTNGDLNSVAADWTLDNYGAFLQDTWEVNYNLSVQYGIRLDLPHTGDQPLYNAAFESAYGFANNATVNGKRTYQPRMSFNYSFDSEVPSQLRGGIGLFQGSSPGVWLSNAYSNTGLQVTSYRATNATGFSPDPFNQPTPNGSAVQTISVTSPSFHIPAVWKASLAFDRELPWWGLVASAEYMYLDVRDAIDFEHLNLGSPTGLMPDGRNSYWTTTDPTIFKPGSTGGFQRANRNRAFGDVILMKSTHDGKANALTLSLEKPFADDWFAKAGWTFTNSSEVSPGTSSVALSNWQNRQVYNPNESIPSRANYEIQQRFTAALSWKHNFFEGLATSLSAFYEGRAGRPYTYTYSNDSNGDGRSGNDLFYVPLDQNDVIIKDPAQSQAFWDYIQSNSYLNSHRGQVVGRNAIRAPWVNQIDLRFSQEVPGFWRDAKGRIDFDILNFTNLLNKKWGHIEDVPFPGALAVAQYAGIDPATGKYVYNYPSAAPGLTTRDTVGESRWAVQATLRYEF